MTGPQPFRFPGPTSCEAGGSRSALLDAVEHDGEIFVVTRGGRGIARVEPTGGLTGAAIKTLLLQHPTDCNWHSELREVRRTVPTQDRAWRGKATAAATHRTIVSADTQAFKDLPGIDHRP